jgi:hypothetical protein
MQSNLPSVPNSENVAPEIYPRSQFLLVRKGIIRRNGLSKGLIR